MSNTELVRWAFDALSRGDLDAVQQLWSEETIERFPDRTVRGSADIRSYFAEAIAGYGEEWDIEVIAIAEEGDHVFVQWKITGRHDGPLGGLEPTGKRVAIDGIDHFVVRDGKVVSNFVVFDQLQVARQVGFVPAEGSFGDRLAKAFFNARTKLARRLGRQ